MCGKIVFVLSFDYAQLPVFFCLVVERSRNTATELRLCLVVERSRNTAAELRLRLVVERSRNTATELRLRLVVERSRNIAAGSFCLVVERSRNTATGVCCFLSRGILRGNPLGEGVAANSVDAGGRLSPLYAKKGCVLRIWQKLVLKGGLALIFY